MSDPLAEVSDKFGARVIRMPVGFYGRIISSKTEGVGMSALCHKRTSRREVFAHSPVQDVGFASTEKP